MLVNLVSFAGSRDRLSGLKSRPAEGPALEKNQRAYTWFFSLAVRIRPIDCANPSFVSPSCFSDVLLSDQCRSKQRNRLRADENTSILSFSLDTNINSTTVLRLGSLGNVSFAQIRGFVNTGTQIYKTVVEDWLHHEDITNLELTAISKWQKNETIKRFLAESALEVDGERQGLRLRIDMCAPTVCPALCRRGRQSKRIAINTSGASTGSTASTDSTPAPTLLTTCAESAPSAAPLRVSLRTRIQICVCGPNAQLNQAAAAGAVDLLDSLNSREFRLLVVQGHRLHAHASEFDVQLYAVIEPTGPTRVGCITPDWGRRERAATKAADAWRLSSLLLPCYYTIIIMVLYLLFVSILSAPRRRPRLRMFQRPLPWARASVQATFMVRVQGVQPTTVSLMVSVQRLQAATVAVIQAFLKDSVVII